MADYINLLVDNIVGADGTPLAIGRFTITPTNGKDQPMPLRIGAATAQATLSPVTRLIENGAIVGSLKIADPGVSDPEFVKYRIEITDLTLPNPITTRYSLVTITADSSGNWDFATMDTSAVVGNIPVQIIPGTAAPNFSGAWSNSATYASGFSVTYRGSSYVSLQNGNLNNEPDTSGSWWAVIAQKGDTGPVTGTQAAFAITRAQTGNVFNPNTATLDAVLSTAGAVIPIVNDPRFFVSDFIAVPEGTYVVCNTAILSAATGYPALGMCFYDITKTYVSGMVGVAAGTPILVPTGQNIVFVRFCCGTGLSDGSGVAATAFYLSSTIPAAINSVLGAVAIVNGDNDANLIQAESIVRGSNINCVLADPYFATTPTGLDPNFWLTGYFPVVPGGTLISNLAMQATGYNCGLVFFDQNQKALIGYKVGAATPVNVPATAVWARASGFASVNVAATLVIVNGSTLPANYAYPGLSAYTSNQLVSLVGSKPLAGKRWIHFGDSISAIYSPGWLPAVAANTGMIQVGQDAQTGRGTAGIFSMFNGAGGTFNPAAASGVTNVWANGVSQWLWDSTKTLAQNLVALTPDIITIYLGTNDTGTTPGTPGDATSAGTMCAYVRAAIEPILAAVPNARIMWIAPYPPSYGVSTIPAINQAIKGTCALYGVPVLDLDSQGAICTQTIPYYLLLDPGDFYVHPNANGCAVLSRLISQFLNSGVGQSASGSASSIPGVFGASGVGHSPGLVPDPGATAGATRYLREDGGWVAPPGTNAMIAPYIALDTGMPAALYMTAGGLQSIVAAVANVPFAITFLESVTGLPWTLFFMDKTSGPRYMQAAGPYPAISSITLSDQDTALPWTWTFANGQMTYTQAAGTSAAVASTSLIVLSTGTSVAISFKSGVPQYTFN